MTWLQRYRIRKFLNSSMWLLPMSMGFLAVFLHYLSYKFDLRTQWIGLGYTSDGAQGIVSAVTSSMLSFIVFFLSILFLAVQLAATQLTPRVISDVINRTTVKVSLGIFVSTYFFSVGLQGRSVDPVPQFTLLLLIILTYTCIATFLYLIGYMANSLRAISTVARVSAEGAEAIEMVYSSRHTGLEGAPVDDTFSKDQTPLTILYKGKSGVFLAFDDRGLSEAAQRNGCVIRIIPQVGRFIGKGDPLFQVYGGGHTLRESDLQHSVAVGPERTIEQDPTFAFRIIVDIAIRALSPAINDPTSAVQCLDQIHRLLRLVGLKDLGDGRVRSQDGQLRLVFPTPNWEDFVRLGLIEIRMYGGSSIQITRRLRAMLDDLIERLPPRRLGILYEQIMLLDAALERHYPDRSDWQVAGLSDYAGIGGAAQLTSGEAKETYQNAQTKDQIKPVG